MKNPQSKPVRLFRQLFNKRNDARKQIDQTKTKQRKNVPIEHYISSVNNLPNTTLTFSLDGNIISHNKNTVIEYLGYDPKEDMHIQDIISNENYALFQTTFEEAKKGLSKRVVFHVEKKNGEQLSIAGTFVPIEPKKGKMEGVFLVLKDITSKRQLEMQLIENNKHYEYIFDHLHVGIWMKESINGEFIFVSKGLEELLQIPLKTLYDQPNIWMELVLPDYREELLEKYQLLHKGKSIEFTYRINAGDGSTKWVYEQTIPRVNASGEISHLFGIVIDVTTEVTMQQKLKYLAKYDPLTTLPNHHTLFEKLDSFISNDLISSFALFYLDLDNFNWINGSLGYQIGDIVLQKTANRLISIVPKDGYLAKLNNNEFIIVIPNYLSKEATFYFAEEVMDRIAEPINVKEYELHVTASIGISFYPENGDDKLNILENARTALYHAKNLGKNNYQIYAFDRDISSHKKYMLEQDLRQAIQKEEFELYYQPQVNPKSGTIIGTEALIRWNHKEWGAIPPDDFIPIAEERHLIHEIGDWVIKHVCKQLDKWRKQGLTLLPVAINVSPIRFLKPGIVDVLKEA